uniref:NADH-ubiquinone oxidoreductase chain 6 n=1 Tax=Neogobius melanostomus TaxID=47308 RepID=A0A1U7AG13_9GOBI|nr:NADH dehydrogenase subunit 6 [Neogobius melanostomus]QWE36303.1 NADH dehydrogenase subunit 6 [Neogobius melanostomus]QWE37109.1 NADH dehydrogenase subunit 6 [Neogobius melanostomus]UUK33594.1 NADH dehydrogenase subunit 6 [Neogobius melanostomus]UZC54675.1 NADH dehydrogenase subunit 6 [Neogobius melanostomus]
MLYLVFLFMQGLLLGLVVVASNPSPYFAALGLVVVSGVGCGLMIMCGGTFLSLVLFLIYLGGMLVVFAYSSALASERHPETLGSPRVMLNFLAYVAGLVGGAGMLWEGWLGSPGVTVGEACGVSVLRGDLVGVSWMYSSGGGLLVVGAWVLLLTLFVVLEVVRGSSRGALRAV